MYYTLIKDGQLWGITFQSPYSLPLGENGITVSEFDGDIPDLNAHVWDAGREELVRSSSILTRLEFRRRFTLEEQAAFEASTDPMIAVLQRQLDVAEYIDLTDPGVNGGLQYLVAVQILTSARYTEIMTP